MTAATRYAHPEAIVGTQWLADTPRDPSLRVFDCTTHLRYETGTGRPYRVESGRADYDAAHIPGSRLKTIPGMGHDLPLELVDEIADAIAAHAKAQA